MNTDLILFLSEFLGVYLWLNKFLNRKVRASAKKREPSLIKACRLLFSRRIKGEKPVKL
jgi:hypothetical protein